MSRLNQKRSERVAGPCVGAPPRPPAGQFLVSDGPFAETKESLVARGVAKPGCYARVNGLRMYYEVHGAGRPLVLLHGAMATIESSFGAVLSQLAKTRRVIAVEQQAHGRTADIDRRLSIDQMARDTAELLTRLDIRHADIFGFSMGGTVALSLAAQHPGLARRLALVSTSYGYELQASESEMRTAYQRLQASVLNEAPSRDPLAVRFRGIVSAAGPARMRRMGDLISSSPELRLNDLRSIRAPTLIIGGEHGLVRCEHTRGMAETLPHARLETIAGDDHDPSIIVRSASMIPAFLDARTPPAA